MLCRYVCTFIDNLNETVKKIIGRNHLPRAYFRGERNSLAWEYYEGYFPFSHRLSANLILKSHKFHIFVIKRSVLGILHGNLSTHARQLTPKITAFDKSK